MGDRKGKLRFQDLKAVDFLDEKAVRELYTQLREQIAALEAANRELRAALEGAIEDMKACIESENHEIAMWGSYLARREG